MLNRPDRGNRRDQGQALIMALAFIAFFALVIVAVLRFADVTFLQHAHTEATARQDSAAEGGAAYGAANASRSDVSWNCADTGRLTMTSGDTVGYTVHNCNPESTTNLTEGGTCLLCILNETPIPPASSTTPATVVLTSHLASGNCTPNCALITYGGNDYINGSVGNSSQITACSGSLTSPACPPNTKARIYIPTGATYPVSGVQPTPITPPKPLTDPLASIGAPSGVGEPLNCSSGQSGFTWSPSSGCSANLTNSSYTLYPGVWNTLSITGKLGTAVTLSPGMYVLTGTLSLGGQGSLCAPTCTGNQPSLGVTIYLACAGGSGYQACPGSAGSGSITIGGSGKGKVQLWATACPTDLITGQPKVVPDCPTYDGSSTLSDDGIAILADPSLPDPGGTAGCVQSGASCALTIAGQGASVNGSIDTRSAGISIAGGGGDSVSGGFLIANSLDINTNGQGGTGLTLSGPGSLSTETSCAVLDMGVYPGATPPPSTSAAVIQAQCGLSAESGVVNINFSP